MQPGALLGHYEIVSAIGKGGMGEVWKARDTRLRRQVALKMLPVALSADPERLARLVREAELLATLNHPNIAAIYGLEEHGGVRFLVLELVEGGTLADRIRREPMPVKQALTIALQIAQALEAAHGKGVVHRDLKPANIAVTPDGRVKVLDFGLAKDLTPASADALTRAVAVTQTGVIQGTPSYMSPEQARGESVGFQTDIWAFGVVCYELLTGRSLFARPTVAETLAQVLEAQPDFAVLPSVMPSLARRVLERCLAKDPQQRMQHMGDVRMSIEDALAGLGGEASAALPAIADRPSRRISWTAASVAVVVLAAAGAWLIARRPTTAPPAEPVRVSIPFSEPGYTLPFGNSHIAISRDGSTVAYSSGRQMWIRRLDSRDAVAIGPRGNDPFFSPDGEWVGYFADDVGLAKVPVRGGAIVSIVKNGDRAGGGTWRADNTIVFATSEGLYQVSANGGDARLLVRPDRAHKELFYGWPQFMPDGESVLFTVVMEDGGARLALLDLVGLTQKPVLQDASSAQYASGHLVYVSGSTLQVAAFDAKAGSILGKSLAIQDVDLAIAFDNRAARFAVADNGALIFSRPFRQALRTLEWIDREGREEPIGVEPQAYGYSVVSPDGTRIAMDRTTRGNRDIWILDLKRLTQTQLTDDPTEDITPVWSADGRAVFFASWRSGSLDVYSQAIDGASGAKVEFTALEPQTPNSAAPDGNQIIVYDRFQDLAVLHRDRPDRLEPLLNSKFDERLGQLSPDGRWLAYESNESGDRFEIFLRPFPNVSERREKISLNGGRYPRWGPKGRNELYYLTPDGGMMAAPVTLSPALSVGTAKKLFDWVKPPEGRSSWYYDVSPVDGRFLIAKTTSPADTPSDVSMILNWLPHVRQQLQH